MTTVPFTSILYTVDSWPWGSLLCTSSEFIKDVSIGVSVFTLTALSGDRFFAIVDPLRKFHAHGTSSAGRCACCITNSHNRSFSRWRTESNADDHHHCRPDMDTGDYFRHSCHPGVAYQGKTVVLPVSHSVICNGKRANESQSGSCVFFEQHLQLAF